MQQQTAVKNMEQDLTPFRRSPEEVMRLARMGSLYKSRMSFMPTLLRQLAHEGWKFDHGVWEIDATGEGYSTINSFLSLLWEAKRPWMLCNGGTKATRICL